MARKKAPTVKPDDLTPCEGKVLRYFVGRWNFGDNQTATDDCIVGTPWSDLPHSHGEAVQTIDSLIDKWLLVTVHEGRHTPTQQGVDLMAAADKAKMWQTAPPPSVTNNPRYIDPVVKAYKPKAKAKKPAAKKKARK